MFLPVSGLRYAWTISAESAMVELLSIFFWSLTKQIGIGVLLLAEASTADSAVVLVNSFTYIRASAVGHAYTIHW